MRKLVRRRPEFESLESLTLLSGFATATHSVAAEVAERATNLGPIVLAGTARGTYRSGATAGSPVTFSATGNISPLGRSTIKGSFQVTVLNPTGTVVISAGRRGAVTADLGGTASSNVVRYTITGGSGRFAGATGSGTATITFSSPDAQGRGRYSTTFQS
jgi:hypothetical protein